jgi:hypothetical protein
MGFHAFRQGEEHLKIRFGDQLGPMSDPSSAEFGRVAQQQSGSAILRKTTGCPEFKGKAELSPYANDFRVMPRILPVQIQSIRNLNQVIVENLEKRVNVLLPEVETEGAELDQDEIGLVLSKESDRTVESVRVSMIDSQEQESCQHLRICQIGWWQSEFARQESGEVKSVRHSFYAPVSSSISYQIIA